MKINVVPSLEGTGTVWSIRVHMKKYIKLAAAIENNIAEEWR
jgi:hypothetical protein